MKYLIFFSVFLSSLAFSAWEPSQGLYKISEIVVEGDHNGPRVYLKTSPYGEAGECTNKSGGTLIRLEPNAKDNKHYEMMYQQLYSSVLSAYVAQSEIKLKMNGCDDWGRPKAIAVWLK